MGKLDDILARLGADVGRGRTPVLLPIEAKVKGPRFTDWQKVSWEDSQRADYRARLDAHTNTGVLLGPPSGGLATLDFDNEEFGEPFFEANPRFRTFLRTRGAKGFQVWFWLLPDPTTRAWLGADYPPKRYNLNHATRTVETEVTGGGTVARPFVVCEWRAGECQSVIHGVHPTPLVDADTGAESARWYSTLVDAPPGEVVFSEIVWPEYLVRPWEQERARLAAEKQASAFAELQAELGVVSVVVAGEKSMTDHVVAAMYARTHAVVYEPDEKSFYAYVPATGVWEVRTRAQMAVSLSRFILSLAKAQPSLDYFEGNGCRSANRLASVLTCVEGEVTKRRAFERVPGVVHCQNGMLDLNETEVRLLPFAPHFMSRTPLPWAYDPAATCPNFEGTLLKGFCPEDQDLMQLALGSFVIGRNLLQKMFLVVGKAGTGKSVFSKLTTLLIGDHNVAALRTEHLGERFEMHGYLGKNLLSAADVDGGFLQRKGASHIKSLTGGDFLQAEMKSGGMTSFYGCLNVLITCNSRLTANVQSDAAAWDRRLAIILSEGEPPERAIPDLERCILLGSAELGWQPEASGVLNFALRGAARVLAQARLGGRLKLSALHQRRNRDLLEESESVKHFIQTQVVKTDPSEPDDGNLTTEELLDGYREYCADHGWNAKPDTIFHNELFTLMLELHRVAKSNSIMRARPGGEGKVNKRGFNHVRLVNGTEV